MSEDDLRVELDAARASLAQVTAERDEARAEVLKMDAAYDRAVSDGRRAVVGLERERDAALALAERLTKECAAWRESDDDVRKLDTDIPNIADALISVNSIKVARRLRAENERKEGERNE